MSFSRAPIRRFNEVQPNSPPVGSYDPKFEGTIPIPYPKGDSAFLMRRDSNWRGSTQSLYSLNSERLSSRSSCYSVASERIATRLHSTGCLGVTRGGRRRVWTGMDGGMESGRTGWWGNVAGKTVSEACVKRSVKASVGCRGGELAKGKLKDQEFKGQGKYKSNAEDSSEVKTKSRIPQLDGRLSGRPKTEAKCEDSREACGKVDRKASYEVDAKAHCQATGETIAFHKGISQKALSASRAADYGKDQLETPSQESVVEWQLEEQTVFRKNQRPRSERRRFQLIRPKPGNARIVEANGLPWKKQIQESNQERAKQRLGVFPKGNDSSLLIDAMERVSRAEEEVEALRTRVDELERENAGLEQARVLTERDLTDEVDWRTEELEKREAVVEKIRASKRRVKQELKGSQAMQENLRLENQKKTEELESTRASVTVLRTEAQRNAEELERALQLVENLRLENSKKAEELENSQLYASHLQSEYVTLSKTLEKSQLLVANLSTEIMAKTTELEGSRSVIRNLQSENDGKSASLEDSWAAIETLQEENLRCKEALRHRQSHVPGHLAGGNSNSKFPQWSRQCPERAFNPGIHQPTFQTKPRRTAIDEDFEMTEELQVEQNFNNGRFAIGGEIPGSVSGRGHDREIELLQSTDSWSSLTGFKSVEDRRLQSEVWKSPSKVQDGFNEAKGCQLRSSLSSCAAESSDDDQQQRVLVVKSEPILTDELTAICNQIQILSLRRKGTSLKTEEWASGSQEEVQGSLASRESETLKQCEENLGYKELESLRELQGALTNREPECQEELQRALESLEFRIPLDIELKDEVPRETGKDPENRDSGELLESLIPNPDPVRIEVSSNQLTSVHDHQSNHTVRLEHSEGRLSEEESKDPDERHVSSEDLIAGKAAGDRKTVENCSEKDKCINAISQLKKTLEEHKIRSGTVNIKKKVESKGTSTEDGGLYKLVDVYGERLENYREKFHPRTSQPQCELLKKFLEKHPSRTMEKRVEKVGEKSAQNGGEKFRESGGRKSGRILYGATFEQMSEDKHGLKLGEKSADNFGVKFKGNLGLGEEKFGAKSGDIEPTGDANRGEYDTALQWRRRYEDLWSVAQPFKDLLSAFHSQRQMLQGHRNAGKAEIEKLSHEFAKVLNHEHERQRISQMLQLRDQNVTLKKELDLLRMKTATAEVTRR